MRDFEDFDAFYAASSRRVLGHVSAMVGSQADAEDAVAEAYLKAWRRWNQLQQYDNPEAWVRQVAYRQAVSTWRKAISRLQAHHRNAVRQEVDALNPDHVALVAALRHIPPDQRRVVVLHHLVGLSVAEIAQETGVAPGTVGSWLSRGRQAMAARLSEDPTATGREHRNV